MDLFDDEETHQLTINEHFAAAYATKKEREELSKLKEKYGSGTEGEDEDAEDDESEEDEDEDGEELTPAMDAAILKTLSRIRRGDPAIYEKGKNVFEEEAQRLSEKVNDGGVFKRQPKDRHKPVTLRDMAVDELLNPERIDENLPTHEEEQAALQAETISAFRNAANGDENDELLSLRNPAEGMKSDAYRQFLLDSVGEDDVKAALTVEEQGSGLDVNSNGPNHRSKKSKKNKGKGRSDVTADEEFLMNYILNRGWVDQSRQQDPTFDEITATSLTGPSASTDASAVPRVLAEDDSDFEDITDRFESSYNFRFEEPNAADIPTHPRTISSAVRRQDDHRKQQREKRNTRKEEEKLAKQEELKRLKALKRKEIEEKLKLLGVVSGRDDINSDQLDLEGDFDPELYDTQMRDIFDDEGYYGQAEESKPSWDDDIDVTDIVPAASDQKGGKKRRRNKQQDDKNDEDEADGEWGNLDDGNAATSAEKKREVDEYMDEYFGLDFNGMVGDLPTRFKYMKVPSTSYGLSPAEILLADDADLNAYMGMKKYAPYRHDVTDQRGKRYWQLKEALKGRAWSGDGGEERTNKLVKKRKGKKERAKQKATQPDGPPPVEDANEAESRPKKHRKVTPSQ